MPIIFKQKGEVMSDAVKVLAKLRKDMGDSIGQKGVELRAVERIPTGIFPLDMACVIGSSLVQDAETGKTYPISEVVSSKMDLAVATLDNGKFSKGKITNWVIKGEKPCLTFITRGGVETTVAEEHAFLTPKGYVKAKDISVGDSLIRPLEYSWRFADNHIDDNLVRFLGYWIADGGGSGDGSPKISKTEADIDMLTDLFDIAESKGYKLTKEGDLTYSFVGAPKVLNWKGNYLSTNLFKGFIVDMGLWDVPTEDLFIPDFVFGLRKYQIAAFIASLWAADGTVHKERKSAIYSTVSKTLAEQLVYLLLRFGIHSYISKVKAADRVMPGGKVSSCLPSYMVNVTGDTNIRAMAKAIPLIGHKGDKLRKHAAKADSNRESYAIRNKCGDQIYTDTIVSIEPAGIQEVYDVTVEPHHNLIIDGVVGHNTGGGIPKGRLSIIWGIESSGKTAIAYNCMRHVQQEGKKAVYVDLEHSMDSTWAAKFGLDLDDLIIITPGFAEQAVDVVEAMLYADDVGIVVIDSIAAMTTDNEIASSAEKMNVGGASYIVGKMVRKAVTALSREAHNKHYPALLCLNQQRIKIGTLYGDPNVMPGGNSLKFASSMTLKLYGKDEVVKEVHPELPTYKVVTGSITKAKIPILSKAFEYQLALIPHGNITVGQSPSWSFVSTYCKNAGFLTQAAAGKPYLFFGKPYPTQKDIRALYETDIHFSKDIQGRIVANELNKGSIPVVEDEGGTIDVSETVDAETGEILTA